METVRRGVEPQFPCLLPVLLSSVLLQGQVPESRELPASPPGLLLRQSMDRSCQDVAGPHFRDAGVGTAATTATRSSGPGTLIVQPWLCCRPFHGQDRLGCLPCWLALTEALGSFAGGTGAPAATSQPHPGGLWECQDCEERQLLALCE